MAPLTTSSSSSFWYSSTCSALTYFNAYRDTCLSSHLRRGREKFTLWSRKKSFVTNCTLEPRRHMATATYMATLSSLMTGGEMNKLPFSRHCLASSTSVRRLDPSSVSSRSSWSSAWTSWVARTGFSTLFRRLLLVSICAVSRQVQRLRKTMRTRTPVFSWSVRPVSIARCWKQPHYSIDLKRISLESQEIYCIHPFLSSLNCQRLLFTNLSITRETSSSWTNPLTFFFLQESFSWKYN